MKILPIQVKTAKKLSKKLKKYHLAILSGEARAGKSMSFLAAALPYKKILVVTQKNAIKDIVSQAAVVGIEKVTVVNYHQVKNLINIDQFDIIVLDEAHRWICGIPNFSTIWKDVKTVCKGKDVIFSSATLTPETYATIYPMLALSDFTPWSNYKKFNHWFEGFSIWRSGTQLRAYGVNYKPTGSNIGKLKYVRSIHGYGKPYNIKVNGNDVPRYDKTHEDEIWEDIGKFVVSMTRKKSGHVHEAVDKLVHIELSKKQQKMVNTLSKDKIYSKKRNVILADTPSKMMQKLHQVGGGFIKGEDKYLHSFKKIPKVKWLLQNIDPKNTIILAHYVEEQKMLAKLFPHTGSITKNAEGVDFSGFDVMVIYSMAFSYATYEQVRARQMNISRDKPIVILYLISGIDKYVYEAVQSKKSFTANWYRRNNEETVRKSISN